MSLADFQPVEAEDHITTHHRCEQQADCHERSVVTYEGYELCFYHAFVMALRTDGQAQRLAIGFAHSQSLSDRFITRRTN